MAINDKFKWWLTNTISDIGSEVINYASIYTNDGLKLYNTLVPDNNTRYILMQASDYMEPLEYISTSVSLPIINGGRNDGYMRTEVFIMLDQGKKHLLFPHSLPSIGPTCNSELSKVLWPAASVALEWAKLKYVTTNLLNVLNNRKYLAGIFPWLDLLVRETEWFKGGINRNNFYGDYSLSSIKDKDDFNKIFEAILYEKSYTIAMPKIIRDITRSGNALFSQHRLIKSTEHSKPHGNNYLRPVITSTTCIPVEVSAGVIEAKKGLAV